MLNELMDSNGEVMSLAAVEYASMVDLKYIGTSVLWTPWDPSQVS